MVTLFELGAHDELVKLGENRDMVSAGKGHLAAPGTRPDRSAFVLAPKWFQEAGQLVGTTTTGLLSPPPPRTTSFRFPGPLWLFLVVDADPLEKQSETIFY